MHFGWIDLRIFRLLEVRPCDLFAVLVGRLMSSISWKVKKSVEIFSDTVDTVSFCQRVADGIGLV